MKEEKKHTTRVAAAIKYNIGQDSAPKIVAAGRGQLARKIEEIAWREDIPIHQDKVLAQALTELGVGVEIPAELYEAVAKILIQVARLDQKLAEKAND